VYMPPEYRDVANLLENHLVWMNRELIKKEISPFILSAIFHYMFVTIHPFMDGNGRLARLLSNYILLESGFEAIKYSSVEKFFEANRKQYYNQLQQHQAHQFYQIPNPIDLTLWIEFVLDQYEQSFSEALLRMQNFENESSDERIQKGFLIFQRHKRLKASEYENIMGLGRTQAVADLNELIKRKLIIKRGGGRSTVYHLCA
ncbi:MAG: Fic family protein, partial [Bdellovibrionales bacterium]